MKVQAATVEQHQFAVRRRGYDRAEVDAVMGQLSLSLRRYEEEMGQLEARLNPANATRSAITDSLAHTRGRTLEHRMEGEQTMTQAEDALTSARQQAQEILTSARTEITKMFDSLTGETEQILEAANRDAVTLRDKADQDAKAMLADASAEHERLRAAAAAAQADADSKIEAARVEAASVRKAAAAEAAQVRADAAQEAANMLEKARIERDLLATRIPELRTALSQFEAQVHALSNDPVVDLNSIEASELAEATIVAAASEAMAEVTPVDEPVVFEPDVVATAIPVPDGSGTLPAARDLVDLDEYRDLKVVRMESEVATVEPEPEPEPMPVAEPVAAEAGADSLERLAGTHVARRGMTSDNETIYQRRGGGLRRRIKAQGDQE